MAKFQSIEMSEKHLIKTRGIYEQYDFSMRDETVPSDSRYEILRDVTEEKVTGLGTAPLSFNVIMRKRCWIFLDLHASALHGATLRCPVLFYTVLQCTELHCRALHRTVLDTLHCTALLCDTPFGSYTVNHSVSSTLYCLLLNSAAYCDFTTGLLTVLLIRSVRLNQANHDVIKIYQDG